MYRIIDKRATGKTSRLMLLAKECDGVIACANPSAMAEKAVAYGITGVTFVPYSFIFEHGKDRKDINIFIDEIELFTKYCAKSFNLKGYTLSNED